MTELLECHNGILSEFNDPFKKNCVANVNIFLHNDGQHTATVETKNGDTKGEQRFRSKDVNDLFRRIDNYVNQLK